MDSRVSACCEYRHQCGRLLGSKTAHFKLVKVEGGKPCYRCVCVCVCVYVRTHTRAHTEYEFLINYAGARWRSTKNI